MSEQRFAAIYKVRLGLVLVITLLLYWTTWHSHRASAQSSGYESPVEVSIAMYELRDDGASTNIPCTPGETIYRYGCTVYGKEEIRNSTDPATWRAYPFTQTVMTVQIDGPAIASLNPSDNPYDPAQRYLWDVVATEYGIHLGSQGNKPLSGVKAQAIAARTYIYQRIASDFWRPLIDNSNAFHVFAPYTYDALLQQDAQKQRLLEAVQDRYYMTEQGSSNPIEAFYGSDNGGQTEQGKLGDGTEIAYLKSVPDPISAEYGTPFGTGNGGMSSKGASRWSFGHTSSVGPAGVDENYCPNLAGEMPDSQGYGACWSVRWDDAFQTLTHYYTGIHIRDAANGNQIVTPRSRWNPLEITMPSSGCVNRPPWVTLTFQHTGVDSWDYGNTVQLSYQVTYVGGVGPNAVT